MARLKKRRGGAGQTQPWPSIGDSRGGSCWSMIQPPSLLGAGAWAQDPQSRGGGSESGAKCTTASQPQSLAIFWIAGEIARNFRSEKQIWPPFIAKCIAAATVSLPQRNRNLFPRKNRCVQFDRVNESQTSTANHRLETVHLGLGLENTVIINFVESERGTYLKNLLTPLFLMGCFPVDFQGAKRPLRAKSGKRPITVGKRPIKEAKRPIKAMVLVGISVSCLMGCFLERPPWQKTAPLKKRAIKGSMRGIYESTLVGQAYLLSQRVSKSLHVAGAFLRQAHWNRDTNFNPWIRQSCFSNRDPSLVFGFSRTFPFQGILFLERFSLLFQEFSVIGQE